MEEEMIEISNTEKKIFIVKNIDNVDNSSLIISFIEKNKIGFSKNKNGVFLNLSCLNDNITNKLYLLVLSLINRETNEQEYFKECENYTNILNLSVFKKEDNGIKEYTELSFNKLQLEILSKLI